MDSHSRILLDFLTASMIAHFAIFLAVRRRYISEVENLPVHVLTPLPDKSPYGLLTCQKKEVPSANKSENVL